jgi:hypothetical protein
LSPSNEYSTSYCTPWKVSRKQEKGLVFSITYRPTSHPHPHRSYYRRSSPPQQYSLSINPVPILRLSPILLTHDRVESTGPLTWIILLSLNPLRLSINYDKSWIQPSNLTFNPLSLFHNPATHLEHYSLADLRYLSHPIQVEYLGLVAEEYGPTSVSPNGIARRIVE